MIAYALKSLSRSQRKYCATNRKLLAVVLAVKNFRYYLLGRHFEIITDHASLVWLTNFKNPEGMVARWIQRLSPYDFKIIHRPGKLHDNADGLSRQRCRPCKRPNCSDCKVITENGREIDTIPEDTSEEDEDIGLRRLLETQETYNPVSKAQLAPMLSKRDLGPQALDLSIRAARSRPR